MRKKDVEGISKRDLLWCQYGHCCSFVGLLQHAQWSLGCPRRGLQPSREIRLHKRNPRYILS